MRLPATKGSDLERRVGRRVDARSSTCLHAHVVEEFLTDDLSVLDVVQTYLVHFHSLARWLIRDVVLKPYDKLVIMRPRASD